MRRYTVLLPLLAPIVVYAAVIAHGYDGDPYLRGDCPYYYWTAISLARDHDLDLGNQLPGGLSRHFDAVALDRRGRAVPKHPIVLPLAALPFVALLGPPGALVFNLAQMAALVAVLYALTRRIADPLAASVAVALTATLSFLPHYVWNFSPDVFAALLLVAGIWALAPAAGPAAPAWRDVLGGLALGTACMAKPLLVCTLPAWLLLALVPWPRLARTAAGLAVPLAAWALLNVHLFGAPQVTAYDRIARLGEHDVETYSQRGDFSQPMAKGLKRQFRHPTQGLLHTSAITLVSWLGLPLLARRRPRLAAAVAAGTLSLILVLSTYVLWDSSHYGNRHLAAVVALAALPLAALLDAVFRRRRPVT
jgi:hypothetical protein